MIAGLLNILRTRRRKRRSLVISKNIIDVIGQGGAAVVSFDDFIDSNHVKEVVELSSKQSQARISANIFRDKVYFHYDD